VREGRKGKGREGKGRGREGTGQKEEGKGRHCKIKPGINVVIR